MAIQQDEDWPARSLEKAKSRLQIAIAKNLWVVPPDREQEVQDRINRAADLYDLRRLTNEMRQLGWWGGM